MKHKKELCGAVIFLLLMVVLVFVVGMRAGLRDGKTVAKMEYDARLSETVRCYETKIFDLREMLEEERKVEHVVYEYKPLPVDYAAVPEVEIDETDAVLLAKALWGEYRQEGYSQRAAVCWAVLNRADYGGQSIEAVLTAPGQFDGFSHGNPVDADLYAVAVDVLARHAIEDYCIGSVGRVLPESFRWFEGSGTYNTFRNAYRGGDVIVP